MRVRWAAKCGRNQKNNNALAQGGKTMRRLLVIGLVAGVAAASLLVAQPAGQQGAQELRVLIPKIVAS